jgi:hypothetical protein
MLVNIGLVSHLTYLRLWKLKASFDLGLQVGLQVGLICQQSGDGSRSKGILPARTFAELPNTYRTEDSLPARTFAEFR